MAPGPVRCSGLPPSMWQPTCLASLWQVSLTGLLADPTLYPRWKGQACLLGHPAASQAEPLVTNSGWWVPCSGILWSSQNREGKLVLLLGTALWGLAHIRCPAQADSCVAHPAICAVPKVTGLDWPVPRPQHRPSLLCVCSPRRKAVWLWV